MSRTEYLNGECAAGGKNEANKERRGTEDKTDKPAKAAKERSLPLWKLSHLTLLLRGTESEPFAKRTPKNISGIHWCRQIGTCVTVTGLRKYYALERIVPNYVCYWKLSLGVVPVSNRFSIYLSQALRHRTHHTLIPYSYLFHLLLIRLRKQYCWSVN